jgi:hypothetical protein
MEATRISARSFCTLLALFAVTALLRAHPAPDTGAGNSIHVYLDCGSCDMDYIRREVTFVDYVRDPLEADVHILVTSQQTASGGTEYTLTFIGRRSFAGLNDTLPSITRKSDTDDMRRAGIVRTLKLGLIRYVARSPQASAVTVSYDASGARPPPSDPWDAWVFTTGINGYLNGEESHTSSSLQASASANRTTEAMKVRLSGSVNYSENTYNYESDGQRVVVESYSRGWSLRGLAVASLSPHWSAGGWVSSWASTYNNVRSVIELMPAVEYDLFPYSESTRRQLRFLYKAGIDYANYHEETIYDKTSETLFGEQLAIALNLKEPWGSAYASIYGSHYFHDLNKYNLEFSLGFSVRLLEGFSVNFDGSVAKPHDQVGLPKRGVTTEEVLLQRRELETQYYYWMSFGVSFTFGSIFNSIVNPRFGGS